MSLAAQRRNNYDESSMSISIYDGSMMSLRDGSGIRGARYKSATASKNMPIEIKWKFGKLERKYECAYCSTHLKNPIKFQDCLHRVCSGCFNDILRSNSFTCPTCNHSISREKIMVDTEFNREIQNLPVYCMNSLYGCEWNGILKEYSIHLEDCQYALTECLRGCGIRYQRRLEAKHFADECLRNEVKCDFCSKAITKYEETDHLTVCPKFLIPCPANCGIKEIVREKMQHHLDNECNKHEVTCPFVDSGCTFKSLRNEMGKHLKESPGIHLNLMCKTISLQKKQLQIISEIIDTQKDQLLKLSSKVNTMEKLNGSQIIWKIEKYSEKLNESKSGKKPIIFSPPFLTSSHGYKLALSANLYGDGKSKGKFMSLFLCILKGDYDSLLQWPFGHKLTFTLLDQSEAYDKRNHLNYVIKPNTCKENRAFVGKPVSERNASFGAQRFAELDTISSGGYIVDDAIYIKLEVDLENMNLV